MERWLARLSASPHAEEFVIKGGMLLAAYDARRPTADLDALARSIANGPDSIVAVVAEIAEISLDDGIEFHTGTTASRVIRDQAIYSGLRIAMDSTIATATVSSAWTSTSATRSPPGPAE
ncbi:MAG: nucleotidyl transferase AbiEii/AbiGii toxin family protein [Streptosporangiaceae bacterium]